MLIIKKPRLLVLSRVFPFPQNAGQQLRVYYTLKALRSHFHLIYFSVATKHNIKKINEELKEHCDEIVLLPSMYDERLSHKVFHKIYGTINSRLSGLKFSNYLVNNVEFTEERIEKLISQERIDGVLFEYWHAWKRISSFRKMNIPCILDMHDILWQSYQRQMSTNSGMPKFWKERQLSLYRNEEEKSWNEFDALIAINKAEYDYTKTKVGQQKRFFYTPMGIDLALWPYSWKPSKPPKFAYYGGLSSPHNQSDAMICYREIMPRIWSEFPHAEFWIVGNNPPQRLKNLEVDGRVKVTGFVEKVQDVLSNMTAVLCPWTGTYGFRSRIVEVMALGVPVIASPDAVFGMEMDDQNGIFLVQEPYKMAEKCIYLIKNDEYCRFQSQKARQEVVEKFSYENTYKKLSEELLIYINEQKATIR